MLPAPTSGELAPPEPELELLLSLDELPQAATPTSEGQRRYQDAEKSLGHAILLELVTIHLRPHSQRLQGSLLPALYRGCKKDVKALLARERPQPSGEKR